MYRKKFIHLLTVMILLVVEGSVLFAQPFQIKDIDEKVTISYKWKTTGFFRKDSSPKLILKIKNNNQHKILVCFKVNYYWKTILRASSQSMQYCIKKNRRMRGKMWNLVFSGGSFSKEQIEDDLFTWEISELEIKHHSDCDTRLNIKIKPEIREENVDVTGNCR
jgi:hypothetical protein